MRQILLATDLSARCDRAFDRAVLLAREAGAIHFQAGAIAPWRIVANLPRLVAGRAVRGPELRDQRGSAMEIEALDEPLAPVIDGEIYQGFARMEIGRGPTIRVAQI